jgi:tetratricopeptide (TPR) repeat protein
MTAHSDRRRVAPGKSRLVLRLALPAAVLLLGACATPPPAEPEAPPRSPEDVELTLNLPAEKADCVCAQDPSLDDRTFLERGMQTLAAGDYVEAVQYFQRYRRLENTAVAQWEAEIAIAYASMLPASPFYDVDAARDAYTDLQAREPQGAKHHAIVLMQQALESFVLMERHIEDLENRTGMLEDDLEKREQALKRLRELTLGQPEGRP